MPLTDDACPGSFTEPEAWSDGDARSMVLCSVCVTWLVAASDHFSAASNIVDWWAMCDCFADPPYPEGHRCPDCEPTTVPGAGW